MRLSVSQVKTFCSSKAKWVGMYCLGVKDDNFSEDSLALGSLFEAYLMTGKDDYSILEGRSIDDMEKLMENYDNLKHNAIGLSFKKGISQHKVENTLFGYMFVAYIDNFNDNCIDDIKTAHYLTNKDNTSKNSWSGMSTWEEYELQLWIYMKLTGSKRSRILEVAKHRYKDDRNAHQIIEFQLTEEFDKRMTDRYQPIIETMNDLYTKYKV